MESIRDRNPNVSKPYLTTIAVPHNNGTIHVRYIAYFDTDSGKWYKYDSFDRDYKPTEVVVGHISEWFEEWPPIFIG